MNGHVLGFNQLVKKLNGHVMGFYQLVKKLKLPESKEQQAITGKVQDKLGLSKGFSQFGLNVERIQVI